MPHKSYPLSRKNSIISRNKLVFIYLPKQKEPSLGSQGNKDCGQTKGKGGDFCEMPQLRIKSLRTAKRPLPNRCLPCTFNYQNRYHNILA